MNSNKEFEDKRILVTGGTRGIGAAIVERFMRGGGKVLTTGRSLPKAGPSDHMLVGDLSTREGIDRLAAAVIDRIGGLDILIHNVGGSAARGGGALALSDDDWQQAFKTVGKSSALTPPEDPDILWLYLSFEDGLLCAVVGTSCFFTKARSLFRT